MTISLVILSLASFAIVAVLVSLAATLALPALDRAATLLSPRQRARLWLGLAALPALVGLSAVLASFLPAMGIGDDHCLAHDPHHPHLCPHHVGAAPGIVLAILAGLFALRVVHQLVGLGRGLLLTRGTASALIQASELCGGARVFPSADPQAFVLGLLRPQVYLSGALLSLGRTVVEPALAHEHVHATRRDPLWRALCPVIAMGHLPSMVEGLSARVARDQELAADAEAADTLEGGRLRVAEALVAVARRASMPPPAISFADGDVQARVRALLDDERPQLVWPVGALALSALLVPILVGASHDVVHHALETLLGALS